MTLSPYNSGLFFILEKNRNNQSYTVYPKCWSYSLFIYTPYRIYPFIYALISVYLHTLSTTFRSSAFASSGFKFGLPNSIFCKPKRRQPLRWATCGWLERRWWYFFPRGFTLKGISKSFRRKSETKLNALKGSILLLYTKNSSLSCHVLHVYLFTAWLYHDIWYDFIIISFAGTAYSPHTGKEYEYGRRSFFSVGHTCFLLHLK